MRTEVMKLPKTGKTVMVDGAGYVVERAMAGRCKGCVAFENLRLCNSLPYCGDIENYVIFKKDETENNNVK
jgi:hypothetical protein